MQRCQLFWDLYSTHGCARIELTDIEHRLEEINWRLEQVLSEDDTSMPRLQERIQELERQRGKGVREGKEPGSPQEKEEQSGNTAFAVEASRLGT